MEWRFATGLAAITVAVIALVIYFGAKLSRAVDKRARDTALPMNITWAGNVLFACLVAFWIVCLVARELRPESALGAWVSDESGLIAAVVGSVLFCGVVAVVLEKLGYPIATRGERDDR